MSLNPEEKIFDNVKRIRDNIAKAAIYSGRSPGDIKLVAAAKTHSAQLIKAAIKSGVDAVGENRVQELLEKQKLGAYEGAPLHFIGALQSNKINKIVGVCDLIESVDSVILLERIGKRSSSLDITTDVLLEINIGAEPQKAGILLEDVEMTLESAALIKNVNILGFMAIPPLELENDKNRYYFDKMFKLFINISAKKYDNVSVRFLSMGMSDSYIDAIHAGANIVRIGSALFNVQ
jgi:pyridoxal phosphate enzyme (YggS family)